MEPIADPSIIRRLLNEETQPQSVTPNLRPSYAASVIDQLNRYFAGNPAKPVDDEFSLMVEGWTLALQDSVPEHRLSEAVTEARRNRNSSFVLDVSEICNAWQRIKAAERSTPALGTFDWRGRDVCKDCKNTGTRLFEKRDPILGRDYTYGAACYHGGAL